MQGESGNQWSIASRVIGFEGDHNVWVLCDNLPVLVARDRLRPCNSAELLAFQYMQQQKVGDGQERTVRYRDKYVDESREMMSEQPTKKGRVESDQQLSRATTFTGAASSSSDDRKLEKRKEREEMLQQAERDAEAEAESIRNDETPLAREWKKSKTTGKGVSLLDKVSYLLQDDEVADGDRVGFLQV